MNEHPAHQQGPARVAGRGRTGPPLSALLILVVVLVVLIAALDALTSPSQAAAAAECDGEPATIEVTDPASGTVTGTEGPDVAASRDGPGSGGTPTAKAAISPPTSVSLAYAAAFVVHSTNGADITQTPAAAVAQRAHVMRSDRLNAASTITANPARTSLQASSGSSTPISGGDVASQAPRKTLESGAHRLRRKSSRYCSR